MAPVAGDAKCPEIAIQECGSCSGSYGSLETHNACKDIDLPLVRTVAPMAHWGPRTHEMARPI